VKVTTVLEVAAIMVTEAVMGWEDVVVWVEVMEAHANGSRFYVNS